MRWLSAMAMSALLAISATAKGEELTVMTRNLYLGADLMPVIAASTPQEFIAAVNGALAQVAANDFPERSVALAAEINEKRPHLVALQEAFDFTYNGVNLPPMFTNYLDALMSALGGTYRVAAKVKNFNVVLQDPLGNEIGVVDRDVILARNDVQTAVVPFSWSPQCSASEDGCNFSVFAQANTPVGPIAQKRGFVAVDAWGAGLAPVRFVNTHLEVRDLVPGNPASAAFQAAQALELVAFVGGFPNPLQSPVIVAGDINSTPQDNYSIPMGPLVLRPPYQQLAAAGYTDTWLLRAGAPAGLTCCQSENLSNPESALQERIDVIFASSLPAGATKVKVNLVGNSEADKTLSGLWPSDHAGVVTRFSAQ